MRQQILKPGKLTTIQHLEYLRPKGMQIEEPLLLIRAQEPKKSPRRVKASKFEAVETKDQHV
jgi:hypothetical protein